MSAVSFFNPVYLLDPKSYKENIQNLVEGYFDLTSSPAHVAALKILSYATLILPAIALAIKTYLRYTSDTFYVAKPNLQVFLSFCENHPEFSGLLRKIKNLVNFENLGFRNGVNSRNFCVGSDSTWKNKVFIKSPNGKYIFIRQTQAKNEQLAFLISHRLNLGVVPPTIALEGFTDAIEAALPMSILQYMKVGCDPKTYEISYAGVVVQEGILLEEDQTLFNRDSLDVTQIQKAILFNLITGRTDSGPSNTVVARLGKIMELDNEKLGLSMTDSWLLREFSEMCFDPAVIDDFLSMPIHTIRNVFEEMHAFNFDQSTKSTISQNFDKTREFLILHSGNQVKVKDLAAFFCRLTETDEG